MSKVESFTEQLTMSEMSFILGDNDFGYVYPQGNVTDISKIKDGLQKAGGKPKECELDDYSKGGNGKAKPEFIVTLKSDPNTIIVIECKKNARNHKTELLNKPNGYAVDGALYYAKFLKNDYNVIAVGVSGVDKDKLSVDVYYWPKGQDQALYQKKLHGIFLTPENYLRAINGEKISKSYSLDEIRETAIDFHNRLRTIKVTERIKPIFIAGILIALEDQDFARDYINLSSFNSVMTALANAIDIVLDDSDISKQKKENIKSSFKTIGQNEKLKQIPIGSDNSITWYIEQLEMKIKPMMNNADSSLDALGVFYHEFVKYSGGDGSGLGIVLTPQHLTDFMCELAEIDENSYVADICCGSGSFLVSAMNYMFKKTSDPAKYENIRKHQLHGIELDSDLYVLAIANMIIRKDGKSNVIHGDCFDNVKVTTLLNASKKRIDGNGKTQNDNVGLTAGLLNPPYSQKDIVELEFVEQLLKLLVKGSKAAVVVPMSCAIGTKFKDVRKRLFDKHTLKAAFSMPDDIFYPTATNVCVMVWEAHKPHDSSVKTFFGYCKDDGFVKRKKLGRVDVFERWENIKTEWLKLYKNSEAKIGLSAKKEVRHSDEWLVEAYMETDYSALQDEDFNRTIRDYLAYLVKNGLIDLSQAIKPNNNKSVLLEIDKWVAFEMKDIFSFSKGKRLTKADMIAGKLNYIGAISDNNGVRQLIDATPTHKGNCITVNYNGSVGEAFYHKYDFWASDDVNVLKIKNKDLTPEIGLFLCTVIKANKFRFGYGRKWTLEKMKETIIKLPTTKDGSIDWVFIETYIRGLPYAERLPIL